MYVERRRVRVWGCTGYGVCSEMCGVVVGWMMSGSVRSEDEEAAVCGVGCDVCEWGVGCGMLVGRVCVGWVEGDWCEGLHVGRMAVCVV